MSEHAKPKIAVMLAVYNGRKWICDQLNSILEQGSVEVSVYISIDPSTDESDVLCRQFAREYNNINILPDIGVFGGASKNFFRLIRDVDFNDFDYFSFADQDDIWFKDKLINAVQRILEGNVDAYSSNVTACWPNGSKKLIKKAQPQQQWDYMLESAGPGCTFVLTKKLALEIQSFLIANQAQCKYVALHDWFIYAFARSRGFKWLIDDESHMLYRQHAANVVGANVGIKAKLARWKTLREGWLVEQTLLIANLLGYTDAWPMVKLQRYHFLDRLALIANVKKLRRRLRDRIALALYLLLPLRK